MACEITNMTNEQVGNKLKSRRLIKETLDGKTHIQHADFHRKVRDSVSSDNPDSKYKFLHSNEIIVNKRVSGKVEEAYRKKRGNKDVSYADTADSIISREMGTAIHKTLQDLMLTLTGRSNSSREEIRRQALKNVKERHFTELENGVKDLHKQIEDIQNEIDPDQKAEIVVEGAVFDTLEDIGGSMDVFVIFSDHSVAVYDYKSSRAKGTIGGRLKQQLITSFKGDDYKLQIAEYARILKEVYPYKKIRELRAIPIFTQYEYKKDAEKREPGDKLTGRLENLQMGSKSSEYLRQFAVSSESTGHSSLNKLILEKENIIKKLQKKADLLKDKLERDNLYSRINAIRNAIQDIIVNKELDTMFDEVLSLTSEISKIKDVNKLSAADLAIYQHQLTVYNSIPFNTRSLLDEMKSISGKKKSAIRAEKKSRIVSSEVTIAMVTIESALNRKAVEAVDPSHVEDGEVKAQPRMTRSTALGTRLSEIDHPIFRAFKKLVDMALNETRIAFKSLSAEVDEKERAFLQWGKRSGLTRRETLEMIVNMNTGNMHAKVNQEFYDEMRDAAKRGDIEWLKNNFELRGGETEYKKEYKKDLERMKGILKKRHNNLEDYTKDGATKPAKQFDSLYKKDLKAWKANNDLLNSPEAWLNDRIEYHRSIKPEVMERNYSENYKKILAVKEVKEFYELHERVNGEFRELLGLTSRKIPNNFIANVRKDMMEKLVRNNGLGLSSAFSETIESLNVREEDYELIDRETKTGEPSNTVPILFTNKFINSDGSINVNEKSFDLGKNMLLMARMAYNYNHMSGIEAETNALLGYLSEEQRVQEVTTKGDVAENTLAKTGPASVEANLFKTLRDYYVYGIKYNQRGVTFNFFGKEINSTKLIQKGMNYFANKQLAFAIIPAAAQLIHGKIGAFIEATKGDLFNKAQWYEAEKFQTLHKSNIKMMHNLGHHFDVYTESELDRILYETSKEDTKYIERGKYWGFRRSDEAIDNTIMGSMMRNYGLDENGNHRRLRNLPEGTKSYWDLLDKEHLKETGKVRIEGMSKENFISLKNAIQKGAIKVKGAISADDISGYQANIYMVMMMQFKTWMPGVVKERFGDVRFDVDLDTVNFGRYTAGLQEFHNAPGVGFAGYMLKVLPVSLMRLAWDVSTFGLSPTFSKIKGTSKEARTRLQYEKFIKSNPRFDGVITYEQYLESKQGALRAMLTEMRATLAMAGFVMMLGMEGDDDKNNDGKMDPWYAQFGWGGRILARTFNRASTEVSFTLSPMEFWRVATNPAPLAGLLVDLAKTIGNTADETIDFATGREDNRDKTPIGYYSRKWVFGANQMFSMFDSFYDEDENKGLEHKFWNPFD